MGNNLTLKNQQSVGGIVRAREEMQRVPLSS